MSIEIRSSGIVDDWQTDTLENEVIPRVLSEKGLDGATYMGYTYIKPKQVGIDVARCNVFGNGEEIGYNLIIDNHRKEKAQGTFSIRIQDDKGTPLSNWNTFNVEAEGMRRTAKRVVFRLNRNGMYSLVYKAKIDDRAHSSKVNFGIVPPQSKDLASKSPFGLHTGHCRMLQAANMHWARNGQIFWAEDLSDSENYNWEEFEQVYYWAAKHNIELIPVIQCNYRPSWTPRPLKDYSRFRKFMTELTHHFRERQKYWEIINEPNIEEFSPKAYMEVLKAGYSGAKKGNPDCIVSMGGLALIDMSYLEGLRQEDLLEYTDVISVHPYYPNSAPEKDLLIKLRELRAWRDKYASNKPMWSTEIAWWTGGKNKVPEEAIKDYLVRSLVIQLAYGMEVALWTVGVDRIWMPGGESGLYRIDFTPKPTYVALAVLSRFLSGKKYVDTPDRHKEIYNFQFKDNEETVEVLWTRAGSQRVKIKTEKSLKYLNIFGNLVKERSQGTLDLLVSEEPAYLVSYRD